jgi:PAS domain S-box-containing protein
MIGHELGEVLHRFLPSGRVVELLQTFRHTLDTGEPYIVPERLADRHDRERPEYYEWQLHRTPLPDGRNGVVCYFRDITQQVQTRLAVEESEERFRTLANNMAQLAWMADATGCMFWYNQQWFDFTGTASAEMRNADWQRIVHPDYCGRVIERLGRLCEVRTVWEDTFPMQRSDGIYRWFLSRVQPIRNREGKIIRWLGTHTDITEQTLARERIALLLTREQVARQEAEKANRLKDVFMALASHELKTPLNAICGWARLMSAGLLEADKHPHALKVIHQNAAMLAQLVDDMLDVSKIATCTQIYHTWTITSVLSYGRELGGLVLSDGSRGEPSRRFPGRTPDQDVGKMRRVHGAARRPWFRPPAIVCCEGQGEHLGAASRMGGDRIPIVLCGDGRPAVRGTACDQEEITEGEIEGYRIGRSPICRCYRKVAP